MDKPTRNLIQKATQDARRLLESEFSEQLEGIFDILPNGRIAPEPGEHLNPRERIVREKIVAAIEHEKAGGMSNAEAVAGYLREASYTCLNRFAALKMMEGQGLLQECVSNGEQSSGFREFCGLAPGLAELPDKGYRLYIESLFDELSVEIRVLFDRQDTASLLWPRRKAFEGLLDVLNRNELAGIWGEDETIGWIYQYFNPIEERKAMREASQAPRNSRELAVRNQFFTPWYVVEFLADNTLGRIWYEMTKGKTGLKDFCRYLVRRPVEIFLKPGEAAPVQAASGENLSQEDLLKQPVHILYRPLKDPRTIRMLDPACGSMHFGLYSFDLFERIYEESWELELRLGAPAFVREAGLKPLTETYPDKEALLRDVPRLIIEHNIHGIDIDPRAVQIAGLSLWLRAERSWHNQGVKPADRPRITRSNIVCAEPMPGEEDMRREFTANLKPRVLGQIVDEVFEKMKLAGEAGSLLKIEEEIKEAVAAAGKQWREGPKPEQQLLFHTMDAPRPKQQELRFDVKGITDERFWDQAEGRILDALKDYAEQAENGRAVRRRLFAEDAVRGFSFIDLCRKRYDTVLMNPPFGEVSAHLSDYLAHKYPSWNKNILCAFIEQGYKMSSPHGASAAIYDRTAIVKSTYEDFRKKVLIADNRLCNMADLGWGVLDANVEVTTSVLHHWPASDRGVFIDARGIDVDEKGLIISRAISSLCEGVVLENVYPERSASFQSLPNAVVGYDFPDFLIAAFTEYPSLESVGLKANQGHALKADKHFRLWWEILKPSPVGFIAHMFNGAGFAPYITALRDSVVAHVPPEHLPKDTATVIRNQEAQLLPGICFGKRGEFFCTHVLPKGHIFTVEGQSIPIKEREKALDALALLNTPLVRLSLNKYCGQHKYSGYVNLFPYRRLSKIEECRARVKNLVETIREIQCYDETQSLFSTIRPGCGLLDGAFLVNQLVNSARNLCLETESFCHEESISTYKLSGQERVEIEVFRARQPNAEPPIGDVDLATGCKWFSVHSEISLALGIVLGRWDVRIALDPSLTPKLPDPFDPLPVCPPGMLIGPTGLPAEPNGIASEEWLRARPDANTLPPEGSVKTPTIPDSDYPLWTSWDGILVDDPGFDGGQLHKEDIVRRTREVLSVLWKDKAQDIEQEACEILGVSDLRTYFRKGFFPDHIKRYSKSRRKAPIYWQLSTASGSYSVWLYYHRFTKDSFYKLLNEYVNPKLQFEERELLSARQQYGQSPTASQRKEIAARETFVAELKTFKDEVARLAPLWDPDLNDGVIINFAPLWRLVPQNRSWQKECKTIWDKLVNGDYDWAHLAMHLWPERVVPKCTTDRSLAIAHGLDEALWEEDEEGKWHAKGISKETLNALIQERTSATVRAAMEELLNASVANGASRRKTRRKS